MDRVLLVTILMLSATVAGCIQDPPEDDSTSTQEDEEPAMPVPRVVVAVIDGPVNVYHEHFQTNTSLSDEMLHQFANTLDSEPPQRVNLSRGGTWEERMEADEDTWDSIEKETLYYFQGTNILGISFNDANRLRPASHGTAVAGSIRDMNPDALIVLVQGTSQGEPWAATQPWIDFMSMSYGPPGSVPLAGGAVYGLNTALATKQAWMGGKIPVGAADNSPAPAINDETAGPPWVVGVGGDHPAEACRNHVSALVPDFTANFTQTLPQHNSVDGYGSTSGTSFATPTTAGVMSHVLLEVRRAWNHTDGITPDGALAVSADGDRLTNSDLRAAFNRTAAYFPLALDCGGRLGATPVNPAAPWLQQGWGNIGPHAIDPTVAHVLGTQQAPEKPEEARAFMDGLRTYRETLWSLR